jgi:tRNA threonylcarbamoyladenosine biosynthesis protein TsaE
MIQAPNHYSCDITQIISTQNIAKQIASILPERFIITLIGDLGSGKTTLVKSIAQCLGVSGTVKSPTYTLVEQYNGLNQQLLYHFDLYRLNNAQEWFDLGFNEYLSHSAISLIEWGNKLFNYQQHSDWVVNITNHQIRTLKIQSVSDKGTICLSQLIKYVEK